MEKLRKDFGNRLKTAARDPSVEKPLKLLAGRQESLRKQRMEELGNFPELRERLNKIKEEVLSNHQSYIAELKKQVESIGGIVHLAHNAKEARDIVGKIATDSQARLIVKSKSMTSEEVGLSPALLSGGIEVFETDLGEYIIQLANERPSHIVLPAIHKTKEEIAALFSEKLGMELTEDPEKLTHKAREVLREKFLSADMGITGANALVAENGTVVLVENEGNIRLSTTLPRVHVALAGIEKIVPSMSDLAVLLKLLPRSATGQKTSGYVSMIRGARRDDERDGAREFHLVLLDNGRSRMREDGLLREALKCIRCGACLSACPVYQHVGGHAYGSVYPGPVGAMITSALSGPDESWLFPFACSLCGACSEVCPSKIPIHNILLELRSRWVHKTSMSERIAFRVWGETWSRPFLYKASTKLGAVAGRMISDQNVIRKLPPPGNKWTHERDFPAPAEKTFHEIWRNRGSVSPTALEIPATKVKAVRRGSASFPFEKIETPRKGDPDKFAKEIELSHAEVFKAYGIEAAREQLKRILSRFSGQSMVSWDHSEMQLPGIDELAMESGISIPAPDGDLVGEAAKAGVGITACDFALAETGTLVLSTKPGQERCVSLLPPVHVAVVRADRILVGIDDLFPALRESGIEDFRGLTFISGPSMTADIELVPVAGIHGPGKLYVILWTQPRERSN